MPRPPAILAGGGGGGGVRLDTLVEELLKWICSSHSLPPPDLPARRALAALSVDAALHVLKRIAASPRIGNLSGFIVHMTKKLVSPPRIAHSVSPRCAYVSSVRGDGASPHMVALGKMEFRKAFLLLSYVGRDRLEDTISLESIDKLKSLSMASFEENVWGLIGRSRIVESDRRKMPHTRGSSGEIIGYSRRRGGGRGGGSGREQTTVSRDAGDRTRPTGSARARMDVDRKKGKAVVVEESPEEEKVKSSEEGEAGDKGETGDEGEAGVSGSGSVQPPADDAAYLIPYPGGPEVSGIMKYMKTHVADRIWHGSERPPLKCVTHAQSLKHSWDLCDRVKARVPNWIHQLVELSYPVINRILVSAFVERWYPETNTFHLPVGEMTITLDDVDVIMTGIPITGTIIRPANFSTRQEELNLISETLGIPESDAETELDMHRGAGLRMGWLSSRFKGVTDDADDELIDATARAYILCFLGSTLFPDKSKTRVALGFLSCLSNLDLINSYGWGGSALAYLYRQLGEASRKNTASIAGYLPLLEAWIYEHFKKLVKVKPVYGYDETKPKMGHWNPPKKVPSTVDSVAMMREKLDALTVNDVVFNPYALRRQSLPATDLFWYSGLLYFSSIAEPHYPDRVLRQFGYIQTIPRDPVAPMKVKLGEEARTYNLGYVKAYFVWDRWEDHLMAVPRRGSQSTFDAQCESGYLEWYLARTHRFLSPPDRRFHRGETSADDHLTKIIRQARMMGESALQRPAGDDNYWRRIMTSIVKVLKGECGGTAALSDQEARKKAITERAKKKKAAEKEKDAEKHEAGDEAEKRKKRAKKSK